MPAKKYVLSYDPKLCTGCKVCEFACSLKHTGTCNPARARIRVDAEEDTGFTRARFCHRCEKPPCIEACPVGALSKNPENGTIMVNEELCIGCGECVDACPFMAMFLDPVTGKPISCDLCGGDPMCVKYCSIKALQYKPLGAPRDAFYLKKLAEAFSNPVIQASVYKEEEGYYQKPKEEI